eukprot:TRINITY_DN4695_c0_g1_i2.p2 TRINITY_DN4695_c0_g1~~TRINITY_DN4695_c0_g1_i2.p2  ORF type:complete len:109 (-),score=16.37 TRINITY_DN4695_c0_g1_i2:23-349(-)
MISVNDNEDVHFRKAYFNPEDCPVDCSRPCERVCPADAIRFSNSTFPKHAIPGGSSSSMFEGVVLDRCYGCGRCIPVCPYDKIRDQILPQSVINSHITEALCISHPSS